MVRAGEKTALGVGGRKLERNSNPIRAQRLRGWGEKQKGIKLPIPFFQTLT